MLSIAFVLAVVTSSIPKATLFAIFSGVTTGLSAAKLDPFIANMHAALWTLAAVSLLGTFVCLLRPSHETADPETVTRPRTPSSEAEHEPARDTTPAGVR